MKSHLIQALNKKYRISNVRELSNIDLQHYMFASTTNERGERSIERFLKYGFHMDGLHVLDVGCAYGGFTIAAAKSGANAYGVDINKNLLYFAEQNLLGREELSCKFIQVDATSVDFIEMLPKSYFDLIIVNDVFEHVYDTMTLLNNLTLTGNNDATIFFEIPNGTNIQYAITEPHCGYLGLSILSPHLWCLSGISPRNIYYRPWEYYSALFHYFGFTKTNFTTFPNESEDNISELIYQELLEKKEKWEKELEKTPKEYQTYVKTAFDEYEKKMEYDIRTLDSRKLRFKYLTPFWRGFSHKSDKFINKKWYNTEQKNYSFK